MIVREFRDFLGKELIPHYGEANYNANKRLYQNRLPVLSDRLFVRLAAYTFWSLFLTLLLMLMLGASTGSHRFPEASRGFQEVPTGFQRFPDELRPASAPKWSISNKNLIENQ